MAIGNDYSGNNNGNSNNNKLFENTYYSRIKMKQQDSKLSLAISYRSGLMIFDINEVQEGFKYESLETIHLSPTKAKLLSLNIDQFKEYMKSDNIDPNRAFGVNAGMNEKVSFIGFHGDSDKNTYITIGKFDGSGVITEEATIMLNRDYHYALEWNNIETNDVAKAYYDGIELDQIQNALDDFSRYMSGALAYSVIDTARFDTARILKKMDPIYDKLGIERRNNGNGGSRGSNSFLDNAGRTDSNHTSMEGIEELME